MKNCPECGESIADDAAQSCPNCGYSFPETQEKIRMSADSLKKENPESKAESFGNASQNARQSNTFYQAVKSGEQLSNYAKVFLMAATIILPGVGGVAGIICGLLFMNKDSYDYRSFGKTLLVLGIIIFSLQFIGCCCAGIISAINVKI